MKNFHHWQKPWNGYIKPFKIIGNLYFVGSHHASTHIIDTGDGLIMIDSGYPQTLYLVLANMSDLGLNFRDIKYIVHSHGHYDHLGATKALIELTGAKTFLGKADFRYADGTLDLTWAKELGSEYYEAFTPDVLLSDGDTISLGNTTIKCISTPGHTPGTMSFFFDVYEGENTYKCAMHGGVGLNSMKKDFLQKYGLSTDCRLDFINGLKKVRDIPVDIFIGNHVGNNKTEEKAIMLQNNPFGKNPFINKNEWRLFIDECIKNIGILIKNEEEIA